MKNQKHITFFLSCLLFFSCLAGCGAGGDTSAYGTVQDGKDNSILPTEQTGSGDAAHATEQTVSGDAAHATEQTVSRDAAHATELSGPEQVAYAIEEDDFGEKIREENLKSYEEFGMTYDPARDELWYQGKLVRWFEDYYPVDGKGGEEKAGMDLFNENGVTDVYAVRDFGHIDRHADGSFDPSGTLVALKEFTQEEFAARDIDAIKNPPVTEAVASEGEPMSPEEAQAMAEDYAPFGVDYDAKAGQWYFKGEKVRYFLDILSSNGESMTGGKFQGVIRSFWNDDGTVDIYAVRDAGRQDKEGTGLLTAVEAYSQKEFEIHTSSCQKDAAISSQVQN